MVPPKERRPRWRDTRTGIVVLVMFLICAPTLRRTLSCLSGVVTYASVLPPRLRYTTPRFFLFLSAWWNPSRASFYSFPCIIVIIPVAIVFKILDTYLLNIRPLNRFVARMLKVDDVESVKIYLTVERYHPRLTPLPCAKYSDSLQS